MNEILRIKFTEEQDVYTKNFKKFKEIEED